MSQILFHPLFFFWVALNPIAVIYTVTVCACFTADYHKARVERFILFVPSAPIIPADGLTIFKPFIDLVLDQEQTARVSLDTLCRLL